ncbi:MAG: B12-binding domain-containing radical SAM protein [Phycisphaeraceae bacterium]|nr:B12-binding domain-containing radical SAM protein [Phycisphaeraceae bacterium]
MKILLVLPAAESCRVTSPLVQPPRRRMLRFSILPLTTVAALTPAEHAVAICDENVQPVDMDAEVDVVGISFMTALAPRAYELARAFRARGRIVVAGGYHPTLCPDDAAKHFDAVVVGEAEGLWPKVLADIQAGTLKPIYRATAPVDLSKSPPPRRDLMTPIARYYATSNALQTGRGCIHSCAYCSIAAFHHQKHRSRPLPRVFAELKRLPRWVMFVDDNIIADPDYARRLFRAMIPLRKHWISQCSIKIADDPDLLRLARRAGCVGLFIGVESLSPQNLADVGKDFNQPARYLTRLRAIRRAGIGVQAGVIVGLDSDGPEVFQNTLAFLQQCPIDALQLNILTPLPGTPLYQRYLDAGRIIDHDWAHYDFFHTVIEPKRMTAAQLQSGAEWLYAQYYRLDRILLRALRALPRLGIVGAVLLWRLNMTYRYDNRRLGIVGRNPARTQPTGNWWNTLVWTFGRWATARMF